MKNMKIEKVINIRLIVFLKFVIFWKIFKYFSFFKIKSKIRLRVIMHNNNNGKPVTDFIWGPSDLPSAVLYVMIDNIKIKIKGQVKLVNINLIFKFAKIVFFITNSKKR